MKITFLFCIVFFCSQSFHSQERRVFASAGKDFSTSTHLMTFTVGEPVVYGGANSTYQLNNGFIQPFPNTTINPSSPSGLMQANGELKVYPNPFGTYIMLNGPSESEDQVRVQLLDMNGKLILEQEILPHYYKLEIPQHCPPGNYLLNFYTLPGQFIRQTRMIKMNSENNK